MTKRELILEASEELFAEFGYAGTSVRMISKKAGVNVAMISYYFGSKEKLFAELVDYKASYIRQKIQTIQKDISDPVLQIEQIVDAYVDRIMSQHRFHRILHRQISLQCDLEITENIISVLMKNINEIKKLIEDGIQRNVFRKVDTEFVMMTFFGSVVHIANTSVLSKKILNLDGDKHISEYPEIILRLKNNLITLMKNSLLKNNHHDINSTYDQEN